LFNSTALILLTNSVLLLQPTHTPEQKRIGAVTHGILNSVALASFTTAVIIIIYNKAAHNAAHFTTAHGKIGLITYILLIFQVTFPFERVVTNVDFCGSGHVLFPASIWISGKGEGGLEISSRKWICGMESCACELCFGYSE
jgi:hypothetical protein